MAIVRWDPARELTSFQSDMNRLFDSFFRTEPGDSGHRRWVPAMDLVETDDALVLRADLPGMTEDDITVEVQDRTLTVSGERKAEHEEKGEGYYRVERSFGEFSRSVSLPEGVDEDAVEAEFEKGVLQVRIPKPEERKPTRIQIGKTGAIDEEK